MNAGKKIADKVPTLEELLAARGIHKNACFDDYQDYIVASQAQGARVQLVQHPRIHPHGSMHLALGRTTSVKRFWSRGDKR